MAEKIKYHLAPVQYWLAHIITAGIFQIMAIDSLTYAPACDITLLSAPCLGSPET